MANRTKNRVTQRTLYTKIYERPIDTQVAPAGIYIDKITKTFRPFEKTITEVKPIPFDTMEEALAFEARINCFGKLDEGEEG